MNERTSARVIKLLARASKDLDDATKMLRSAQATPEVVLCATAQKNIADAISRLAEADSDRRVKVLSNQPLAPIIRASAYFDAKRRVEDEE